MATTRGSSEFGGVGGLIQPLPHELTNVETARLERSTEAADETDSSDAALIREWERERKIGTVAS